MPGASSEKHRALLACCRPEPADYGDKKLREALQRMEADPALRESFAQQAEFDEQMAAAVGALPLPETLPQHVQAGVEQMTHQRAARALLRQPALWAVLLAGAFMLAWGAEVFYERATGFPGDEAVTRLLDGLSTNSTEAGFEAVSTESGKLGDTLFLKYGVNDYAVPAPFSQYETLGYRVFDRNDGQITQVHVAEHGLTFLVFRADQQGVDIQPPGRWKLLDGDRWAAAVQVRNHICFIAACRGTKSQMNGYLREAESAAPSP